MLKRATFLIPMSLLVVSCHQPKPQQTSTDPSDGVSQKSPSGITVEAEGLPQAAKDAVAEAARGALAEAIHKAIQEGVEELFQKLTISDDIEKQLLLGTYDWGRPEEENDSWRIILIRPGDTSRAPVMIELVKEGRTVIRFTRIYAGVERPVAIISRLRFSLGQLAEDQLFLTYGPDGKWSATRPSLLERPQTSFHPLR
jgi:hypothetical protein